MIADLVLVGVFGLLAPIILTPIGRNWGVLAASFAVFLLIVGFLLDGLRTLARFRKLGTH